MRGIVAFLLANVFVALFAAQVVAERERLTAEELVTLILAAKEKYTSISCDIHWSNTPPDGPVTRSSITWHWRGERAHYKIVTKVGETAEKDVREYAFAPTFDKELALPRTKDGIPRGIIEGGTTMSSEQSFLTPVTAMWNPFGYPLTYERASVSIEDGLHVLAIIVKDNGLTWKMTVDPEKGYLPLKSELWNPDRGTIMSCECAGYREVKEGLWFPFEYTWTSAGYVNQYIILSAEVNADIPDTLLDFSFPKGTIVSDRVANLKYTVDADDVDSEPRSLDDGAASREGDIITPDKIQHQEVASDLNNKDAHEKPRKARSGLYTWTSAAIVLGAFCLLGAFLFRRRR